jgi:hypothetical protein
MHVCIYVCCRHGHNMRLGTFNSLRLSRTRHTIRFESNCQQHLSHTQHELCTLSSFDNYSLWENSFGFAVLLRMLSRSSCCRLQINMLNRADYILIWSQVILPFLCYQTIRSIRRTCWCCTSTRFMQNKVLLWSVGRRRKEGPFGVSIGASSRH